MLFGSAMRVNEIAKLKVSDMIRESGELKTTFSISASYTKTNKSSAVFILAKPQIKAIEEWICERLELKVFISDNDKYRGLNPNMPMFAITRKGKSWRTMAFRDKKYKDKSGLTRTSRIWCKTVKGAIHRTVNRVWEGVRRFQFTKHEVFFF
jgi:hypothetical protein